MKKNFVEFKEVSKIYKVENLEIRANDKVSFSIKQGEFCVVVGQSGAGKTTILNILGGIDSADEGEVLIDGINIVEYKQKDLTKYRRYDVGFVFQFYNLMPQLTALENVEIASEICKSSLCPKEIIKLVGLEKRAKNFPAQLSGGEQQRVSIARAIAKNPKILLCDEPTGALDVETGKSILKLLLNLSKNHDKTVILVTHNKLITEIADHVIEVKNGKVFRDYYNEIPKKVEEVEW